MTILQPDSSTENRPVSSSAWNPATSSELSHLLAENFRGARKPLVPSAERFPGDRKSPGGEPVIVAHTGQLNRVVDYPARDMTIAVEAGMRVAELQALLAAEHQQLPIDIPQPSRTSIGGAIAANLSGPARYGFGTFRDYLLGFSALDSQGARFAAGGRVVKNVAGYDLCKLMIGSFGTLGVLTQVTLKLTPLPQSRAFILVRAQQLSQLESVLAALNLSAARPVILDLLNSSAVRLLPTSASSCLPLDPYLLCIGFAGSTVETAWQLDAVIAELKNSQIISPEKLSGDDAWQLWQSLTEFQLGEQTPLTFRASVLPSRVVEFVDLCTRSQIAVQSHAGNGVIVGHFPQSPFDAATATETLTTLREQARAGGGDVVVSSATGAGVTVGESFRSPVNGDALTQKIKETFDPAGILNPGHRW